MRSKYSTHFFFAGYHSESDCSFYHISTNPEYKDIDLVVQGPGARKWYFRATVFDNVCNELEKVTNWHFSGGVDFLLLDAVRSSPKEEIKPKFDEVISFDLLSARENKQLEVLSKFFEQIFRYSRENLNTSDLSDDQLIPLCSRVGEGVVKRFLPEGTLEALKRAGQYAVKDLRK